MERQEMNEKPGNETNMSLLGDYLKQKRQEKNFTLEKLSQKTKISINILKSLESNDYDHLPSAAYIKGFVTSYVKVLGLPRDEAINKMEYTYLNVLGKPFPALDHTKLMATPNSNARPEESPHEVIESGDSIIENTKSMLPLIIFGVVIVLFVGGYKLISTIVENEVSSNKSKDLGPKIESSSALVNQPAKTEEAVKVETDEEDSVTPPPENIVKEAPAPVPVHRNFPSIDFKKIRSKLFTVNSTDPVNENTEIFPEAIRSKMTSSLQNVYIKAIDGNTWLSYKIDEKPIESVIINKGNDLFLQGNEIRVFLGNVGVTKIFYNNYLIDTPTTSGVKSLVFPEESNSKYLLPLFPKANDDILYTSEDYIKRMKMEEEEVARKKD